MGPPHSWQVFPSKLNLLEIPSQNQQPERARSPVKLIMRVKHTCNSSILKAVAVSGKNNGWEYSSWERLALHMQGSGFHLHLCVFLSLSHKHTCTQTHIHTYTQRDTEREREREREHFKTFMTSRKIHSS